MIANPSFYKEEIRSGFLVTEKRKKVWAVELKMLEKLDEVCKKYNLTYYAYYGTLLGAVRHQGFIPWDDDIDINMQRKDIPAFLDRFRAKYGEKYWIHVPGESSEYSYLMIHVMTKDVKARALVEPKRDDNGLCADIFIIENAFDNCLLRRLHGTACMGFRYILSCLRFLQSRDELVPLGEQNEELKRYVTRRLKVARIVSVIPLNLWCRLASWCMALCKNEHSRYVTIPGGQHQYFREMYVRKDFCELTDRVFEGRTVKISKDYDTYLKILYGDYMKIPPMEKRERHVMMELDRDALKKYAACSENLERVLDER